MSEVFTLPVTYLGQDYDFQARFLRMGYIHQFHVDMADRTVIFEFDEEGDYRAIDHSNLSTAVNPDLIRAIIDTLLALQK